MNMQLPELKFTEMARDFSLASPFNQDSSSITEDNADLRGNQVKPCDFFFLQGSAWLVVVFWFFFS